MEDGPNFCGLLRIQSKLYYFIFVLHLGYWLILTDASIKETALSSSIESGKMVEIKVPVTSFLAFTIPLPNLQLSITSPGRIWGKGAFTNYVDTISPIKIIDHLKYGFCKKLLWYKWTSDQLNTFFPHFLTGLLCDQSKSEEKSVQLVRGSFVPK